MIIDLHVIHQLLKEILASPHEEEKRWDKHLGHLKQCRKSDGFLSHTMRGVDGVPCIAKV